MFSSCEDGSYFSNSLRRLSWPFPRLTFILICVMAATAGSHTKLETCQGRSVSVDMFACFL